MTLARRLRLTGLMAGSWRSGAVVAVGLTCNGEELDPAGTIRSQWLALDDVLIMGEKDASAAALFENTGMNVFVVPDLANLSSQDRP